MADFRTYQSNRLGLQRPWSTSLQASSNDWFSLQKRVKIIETTTSLIWNKLRQWERGRDADSVSNRVADILRAHTWERDLTTADIPKACRSDLICSESSRFSLQWDRCHCRSGNLALVWMNLKGDLAPYIFIFADWCLCFPRKLWRNAILNWARAFPHFMTTERYSCFFLIAILKERY